MPLIARTITAVALQDGYLVLTIGPETHRFPVEFLRRMAQGTYFYTELMFVQVLLNLVTGGVDLTSPTAVRAAIVGMTIQVGS